MATENHIYYGQDYRINLDHLAKVLTAKRELGLLERHQFDFSKNKGHIPGVCSCYDCDIQMAIIVEFKGKLD